MALWNRSARTPDTRAAQIEQFWQWWSAGGADACGDAVGKDDPTDLVDVLAPRVEAIHTGLAWEIAPGREAVHLLVVSADGDPELRALARRWRDAGPGPDAIWSYADARPGLVDLAGATIEVGGHEVDLDRVRVGVRRVGTRVDVAVSHPVMAQLGDQRTLATFLILDSALGEVQTETWIGELAPSDVAPLDGFGLSGLRAVVRDLAQEFVGADGAPVWVQLQGTGPGGPVVATARVPLAAASEPLLDTHVAVTVPYDRADDGMPTPEGLSALRTVEDALADSLGEGGQLIAHETTAGARRLHYYLDGSSTVPDQVVATAREHVGKRNVEREYDPGWSAVQHLR
ncbi:DUF695 domain-containing protein [Luteipulveratus halotolerans]|uniref:Uncharacterized protein n=1 Tax=Luteipulveratus halotolerans TaxID=1631356 RepID=A0A0L6CJ85_9MICO|nr:DUF695 domain-containing protein [Luteipulveratus halotolerans]KNX37670.1 hypothetical protein VV01_11800 [Luteipulveratus halotolerans]